MMTKFQMWIRGLIMGSRKPQERTFKISPFADACSGLECGLKGRNLSASDRKKAQIRFLSYCLRAEFHFTSRRLSNARKPYLCGTKAQLKVGTKTINIYRSKPKHRA